MKRVILLLTFGISAYTCFSQIRQPQTPQFPTMQPLVQTPQPAAAPRYDNAVTPSPYTQAINGATAQDIINRSGGQNNPAVYSAVNQKQQELQEMLKEVQANAKKYEALDQYRANVSTDHIPRFESALKHLSDMLSGKARLSVADAYYTIESAFGSPYLTREEYNNIIKESVGFIKEWMKENKLDPKDNYMVQYAIQKFMSQTLTIHKTVKKSDNTTTIEPIEHKPFRYDYNDYQGAKDYRNLFVTKCLATGFGQCASMPVVYLVLAEGLGVKAYLTFAPQHSFIKYPDNNGYINNYEPTSNWEISDKWYKDNMFISAKAVETGIYLDTLNSRQVVANCIFELAVNYCLVDRTGREDFILSCLRSGGQHFPKNNNLNSLFVYAMHLKTMLREEMRKSHIGSMDDLGKSPVAKKYYEKYIENEAHIAQLGYVDIPAGMYEDMLNQQEFKGKLQQEYNINGKEKRNLFSTINQ